MDGRLAYMPKPKPTQHQAMRLRRANGTPHKCHSNTLRCRLFRFRCRNRTHYTAAPSCRSAMVRRRRRSTSSGFLNCVSPSNVARTVLKGLPRPSVFATTLCAPTNSTTARTAPPATIPVPSAAGLRSTCSPPKRPCTSCGIEPPLSATCTRCFLACSTAFDMATGTSAAFPLPIPTQPWPSPTTTRAQKLNRLPPFTTFATRLMKTTLSFRFSSSGLTRTQCLVSSLPTRNWWG